MAQAKWLKLGAAAILSVGMLTACGDAQDEAPVDNDVDVTPEEGEEEVIPEGNIDDTEGEHHEDESEENGEEESGS